MKSRITISLLISVALLGCGVYSMTGIATTAKTIAVDPFFNNTNLGPANLGQTFTNKVKDYYQQNSNLKVVPENGELHIEGIIAAYDVNPIAPVSTGDPNDPNYAALSRLTISVKVSFEDTIVPKNSFKDRTFSFYRDFDNNSNFTAIQEDLEKKIIDQILIDIYNATVANW